MPPPGLDLTTPTVTLRKDVMKGLNTYCGASSCHGNKTSPEAGLFLGASTAAGADAARVRKAIVGVASTEVPAMVRVQAGDPEHSYLMHKLDGDQCLFNASCAGGDCMDLMPLGSSDPLSATFRDTVRRWIAQGALDN
jgi:hypothetical protein